MSSKTVCRVSTFHDGTELWVSHASLLPGGTDRAWTNANFDDVSTTQDQLLNHLTSHNITSLQGGDGITTIGIITKLNVVFNW